MRRLLVLILLSVLLPPAVAQEPVASCSRQCTPRASDVNDPATVDSGLVRVIQYGHFEGTLANAPLNTLPPDPKYEKDINKGFLLPSVRTKHPFDPANLHFKSNEFVMEHCPGTIEFTGINWRHFCHMRPLGADMVFGEREIPVYFYVSPGTVTEPARVGVSPSVRMDARMITGMRGGVVIAENQAPATSTLLSRPGGDDVFELRTVMILRTDQLTQEAAPQGYRVQVDLYQHKDNYVEFQQEFRVRTGPLFPPRIILPLIDPLQFQDDHIRVDGPSIYYYMRVKSMMGAYDVDGAAAEARLYSGSEAVGPVLKPVRVLSGEKNHDGVSQPIMIQFAIDTSKLPAAPPLRLETSVPNLQGTYVLHHSQELPYARFDGKETIPTVPFLPLLLILAFLALVLRRRDPQ